MSLTILLIVLTSFAALYTLYVQIKNAPEGTEDESGFHATAIRVVPKRQAAPVHPIWMSSSAHATQSPF